MNRRYIGRYEIKLELGRGGMGTVYQAYDPRFQRDVALKIIPREFLHDPTFRTRFEREAQTIAVLEHPAIVPVYDYGEEDGQPYLVMRFLPGGSLTDRLEQGRLTFSETVQIIERLASALDEAHRSGIIHRDLKPDNILFDHRDDPFITDFGIAKLSEDASSPLTSGSLIIGTPAYMSPEQANGDELDGRSDIYALGVILFEMLTGNLPYEANTPIGLIMQHITQPIPNILELNSELPPESAAIINQAMAKDPERRYPTALGMAEALRQAALPAQRTSYVRLPHKTRAKTLDLSEESPVDEATPQEDQLICPKCDTVNASQTRFCTNCRTQLRIDCPLCYTSNRIDAVHCLNCGADLKHLRIRQRELQHARKQSLEKRDQAYKEKASRQLRTKLEDIFRDLGSRRKRESAQRQLDSLIDSAINLLTEDILIDRDSEARYESVRMLGRLCDRPEVKLAYKTQVTQAFIDIVDDSDPKVRQQVQQELRKLGIGRSREISDIFKGLVGWIKGD